jgi:hypothetical protein
VKSHGRLLGWNFSLSELPWMTAHPPLLRREKSWMSSREHLSTKEKVVDDRSSTPLGKANDHG